MLPGRESSSPAARRLDHRKKVEEWGAGAYTGTDA